MRGMQFSRHKTQTGFILTTASYSDQRPVASGGGDGRSGGEMRPTAPYTLAFVQNARGLSDALLARKGYNPTKSFLAVALQARRTPGFAGDLAGQLMLRR